MVGDFRLTPSPLEVPSQESKRLRSCVNDLIRALADSEIPDSSGSDHGVGSLLRAIVHTLQLDFACLRLAEDGAQTVILLGEQQERYASRQEFRAAAEACLDDNRGSSDRVSVQRVGDEAVSIACLQLGLPDHLGDLVAGSRRQDFPDKIEQFVLDVAVDQALIRLQGTERESAKKQTRAHEQERERQTRAIVESIPAHIGVFSPDGEIEFLNAPLRQYWGTSRGTMAEERIHDMVHPEDLVMTAQAFAEALRTGGACDIENRLRRFDGSYRWFNSRGLPLRNAKGEIVRWYFLFLDVEDRRRAQEDLSERERQLRRSEAFVSEGQRLSQCGTFYWNTATDELRFSEENYRTNEIEPGTPLTMALMASRIHPDDQGLIQEKIAAGQNDRGGLDYEIRLKVPSGKVKWVHTISRRYENEDGSLAYIGAVQDVTERHHAEEALSKLRSELAHLARLSSLGALTASIAHEVNQPLAGITTNASTGLRMLSADPPNVPVALETVRRTIRDAGRAAQVIARLREMFSKKETPSEEFNLNEAAREVIALCLTELQRSSMVLQTQYARELPPIYGDRVQLQQVILNLLLNAADATRSITDRARDILLKTELEQDGDIRLTVVDSGSGIDPELTEKLFEPFFTTKETGMGIGLSVCRSIIERHHGRIWAEPNDGPGTAFSFSIPVRAGQSAALERVSP